MEQFLFAPVNPTGAAVFRVALAVILAVAFWPNPDNRPGGVTGWLPGSAVLYDQVFLSGPYWMAILVGLMLLGAGWRPRVLGLVLAALLAPLALLQYGQLSRHVLLITLAIFSLVRSDAQWSLGVWLGGSPAPSAGPMWPIRLIQLQLSALYGVNALAKTTPDYLSGEVFLGMSRMLANFHLEPVNGLLMLGPLLVPVWLLASASAAAEWVLALGFWFRRLRVWLALFGLAFHFVVRFVVTIYALDLVSVFLYLAFLLPFNRVQVAEEGQRVGGERALGPDIERTTVSFGR